MWSAWSAIAKLGPPRSSSEISSAGTIAPCSVRIARTAWSVTPPGSWWPRIGTPLMAAMSTALPIEWYETLPEVV